LAQQYGQPLEPVRLDTIQVKQCYDFACEAERRRSQSQKQFGTYQRSPLHFIADQTEGKMAEMVLSASLASLGYHGELDFAHYDDQLQVDEGDIKRGDSPGSPRVDAKGSSHLAQWLLVEDYKMVKETSAGRAWASDIFIFIKFDEAFPTNGDLRANPQRILGSSHAGQVVGWAHNYDFHTPDGSEFWFVYEKGDRPYRMAVIPNRPPADKQALEAYIKKAIAAEARRGNGGHLSRPLDARLNYGLPVKWLRQNWAELMEALRR
jgi:hypothetical protein